MLLAEQSYSKSTQDKLTLRTLQHWFLAVQKCNGETQRLLVPEKAEYTTLRNCCPNILTKV